MTEAERAAYLAAAQDQGDHVYADKMRGIADLLDALVTAESRWEPGDIGLAFAGTIEVYSGEVDELGGVAADKHIGWVQQVDGAAWVFVPLMPHGHWSHNEDRWVDIETIRAENRKHREVPTPAAGSIVAVDDALADVKRERGHS